MLKTNSRNVGCFKIHTVLRYKVQGWWRGWLKHRQPETGPMKFDGTAYSPGGFYYFKIHAVRPHQRLSSQISYDRPSLYELRYLPYRRRIFIWGRRSKHWTAYLARIQHSVTHTSVKDRSGQFDANRANSDRFFLLLGIDNCRPLLLNSCSKISGTDTLLRSIQKKQTMRSRRLLRVISDRPDGYTRISIRADICSHSQWILSRGIPYQAPIAFW